MGANTEAQSNDSDVNFKILERVRSTDLSTQDIMSFSEETSSEIEINNDYYEKRKNRLSFTGNHLKEDFLVKPNRATGKFDTKMKNAEIDTVKPVDETLVKRKICILSEEQ